MNAIKNQTDLGGLLGESLSVRKVNGRVVVKNRPQRKVVTRTDNQLKFKDKFLEATQYAKGQILQDDSRLLYTSGITGKRQSAYTLAVRDYLVAPTVGAIDPNDYHGAIGDALVVKATDDFMVTRVKFIITNASGAVIEEGEAAPNPQKNFLWVYKATVANPALAGTTIKAIAFDRPGNSTSAERVLS